MYVEYILCTFLDAVGMTTEAFVHGKGRHKTSHQRLYEKVYDCREKLKSHAERILICGKNRNSFCNQNVIPECNIARKKQRASFSRLSAFCRLFLYIPIFCRV